MSQGYAQPIVSGQYNTTLGTLTDLDTAPLQLDSTGNLKVTVSSLTSNINSRIYGQLDDVSTVQPMEGGEAQVRITDLRGLHVSLRRNDATGSEFRAQTTGAQSIPVVIASDQDFIKSEDAAHASADKGIMALAVRNDFSNTFAGTDLDYSPIAVDSAGRVRVVPTYTVQEDAAASAGGFGARVMGVRNDASAVLTSTDGDFGDLAIDSSGRLKVMVEGSPTAKIFGEMDDTLTLNASEGNSAQVRITQLRGLHVSLRKDDASGTEWKGQSAMAQSVPVVVASDQSAIPVSVASLPLPSGAATSANQTTEISHLSNIVTSIQLLDDVVFVEDAAHTTGDKGVMSLSVRKDTATALAGTDNDYQPLITDSSGRLHVNVGNTPNVNVSQMGGVNVPTADYDTTGATVTTPMIGIAIPSSSGPVAAGHSGNPLRIDVSSWNAGPVPAVGSGVTANGLRVSPPTDAYFLSRLADGDSAVLADVLDLANSNPLTVAIVDSSGNQIASFGGGTQYNHDAASGGTLTGTLGLGIRHSYSTIDSAGLPASTDGDFTYMRVTQEGRLSVHTASEYVNNTAKSDPNVMMIGGITANNPLGAGGVGAVRLSTDRELFVTLRSGNAAYGTTTAPLQTQIGDGTRQATVRDTGASDSLNVAIVDASGNQITTFGGGSQYTEGDVDTAITGTAILWEDASDTLRAVSSAKPLPVTTIGSVTAGIYGEMDDTLTVNASENSDAKVRITQLRALHVNLRDAAGTELLGQKAMAASIPVVVANNQSSLSVDTELPAAASLADSTANPTTPLIAAAMELFNGTTWDRARGDTTNGLDVDVTRVQGVVSVQSNSANLATQATLANVETSVQLIDDVIQTDDGTGFTVATSKIGMVGGLYMATPDPVSSGDVGAFHMTQNRALHVHMVLGDGTSMIDPVDGDFTPTGNPLPFMVTLKDGSSKHFLSRGQTTKADALPVAVSSDQDASKVDDAAFTVGTSVVNVAGGVYKSTLDSVDDGDAGALAMTIKRALHVAIHPEQTWAHGTLTTLMTGSSTSDGQLQSTAIQTGSADLLCDTPRACVYVEITKTGSPTRFQLFFQWSDDDSTYWTTDIGPYSLWTYGSTEVSGTYRRCFHVPAMGRYLRVQAQASGTANSTNYFTVVVKAKAVYP